MSLLFLYGKMLKAVDFLETIEACEVQVGTYSQINEYMMIYDSPRSRSFIEPLSKVTQIQNFQTSFPQKNTSPLEARFCMEPPWDENLFKYSGSHDQDVFQAHI